MRVAIAGLLLLAAVSSGAHAQFVTRQYCDPTDDDVHEANRVIGEIEEMERAIIEALRKQTGQLAGYDAQGAAAVTQALDSQTRLLAQVLREVEESEATRAYQPSGEGCRTTTGVAGLGPGRENADAILLEAAVLDSGRISQDLAVAAPGGETRDTARRFDAVRTTWCAESRTGQEACEGSPAHHGLDQIPATLLAASTLDEPHLVHAAREVGRNLATPVVTEPIPWDAVTTPAERRAALAERAAETRTALAAEFFAHAWANRIPAVALGEWAAALAPQGARDASRPLSRHELLEHLASRRYDDPAWSVALEAMPAESLLREISRQMAVSLILDWERYLLEERRGALAAARLAIAVEESRTPHAPPLAAGVN